MPTRICPSLGTFLPNSGSLLDEMGLVRKSGTGRNLAVAFGSDGARLGVQVLTEPDSSISLLCVLVLCSATVGGACVLACGPLSMIESAQSSCFRHTLPFHAETFIM